MLLAPSSPSPRGDFFPHVAHHDHRNTVRWAAGLRDFAFGSCHVSLAPAELLNPCNEGHQELTLA